MWIWFICVYSVCFYFFVLFELFELLIFGIWCDAFTFISAPGVGVRSGGAVRRRLRLCPMRLRVFGAASRHWRLVPVPANRSVCFCCVFLRTPNFGGEKTRFFRRIFFSPFSLFFNFSHFLWLFLLFVIFSLFFLIIFHFIKFSLIASVARRPMPDWRGTLPRRLHLPTGPVRVPTGHSRRRVHVRHG